MPAGGSFINEHLPPEARVGSWNAGVLGYYAERPVVNLDGLINDFELIPYLRPGRIGQYVLGQGSPTWPTSVPCSTA